MTRRDDYAPVIGSCYACGMAVTSREIVRLPDKMGISRKLHRGVCAERFEVQNTPEVEGGR